MRRAGALAALLALAVAPSPALASEDSPVTVLWSVQAAPPGAGAWLASDARASYVAVDGRLTARDLATGRVTWTVDSPAIAHEPAVANGTLVAARTDGIVVAHDAATGERRWSATFDEAPRRAYLWERVVLDVGSRVAALDPATGAPAWTSDAPAPGNRTGRVLTTVAPEWLPDAHAPRTLVTARSGATGATIWSRALDAEPAGSLATTPRAVVVPTLDGVLHALDAATGATLWSHSIGRRESGWIAADEERAYLVVPGSVDVVEKRHPRGAHSVEVPRGDTHLLGVDLASGKLLWSYRTGAERLTHLLSRDGLLFAAGADHGGVFAFHAATGDLAWKWRPGPGPIGVRSLRVENGTFVALDTLGRLHALRVDADALPPLALAHDSSAGPDGLTLRVTATSRATDTRAFAVRFAIDGTEVDTRIVEIPPGGSAEIAFEPAPASAGYHLVELSPALALATSEGGVVVREDTRAPDRGVVGAGAARDVPEPLSAEEPAPAHAKPKLGAPGPPAPLVALALAFAAALSFRARRGA